MELYLQPADAFMKNAGWFDNMTSWFGGGNKPASPQPTAPANRNVGGVVQPSEESLNPYSVAPTQQQADVSGIKSLEKDYHTLAQHIRRLSTEVAAYQNAFKPLYSTFQQMQPAWSQFRQKVYSDPQFASKINQADLAAASDSMKRVLPMIAQMMTEQKKDQVQATQILQNAQPAFQAIAKLVGVNIAASPAAQATTTPAAASAPAAPVAATPGTAAPPAVAAPAEPASAAPAPVASETVPGATAPVEPPKTRGRFQKGNVPHNKGKRRITTTTPGAPTVTTQVAKVIKLFPKQGSSYTYVPNFKLV